MKGSALLALESGHTGSYRLLRRLGVGGTAEVFLARQEGRAGFNRLVVIKRLLPELAERPELVDLFVDEARIGAHLTHPNIVQIYDFCRARGAFFLVMEYVCGHNLARIREQAERARVPLPRPLAVHIVAEVAHALDFAHQARDAEGRPLRVVHRDVSPHNVLIARSGDVKLVDFGIAKAANRLSRTETGVVRGKLSYMAPEQAEGGPLDARVDVFAAGILLWELSLMRRLFDGDSAGRVVRQVLQEEIPRPSALDPQYPPGLEIVVMGALERRADQRISTAGELLAGLRAYLASVGSIEKERVGAFVRCLFPAGANDSEDALDAIASAATTRPVGATQKAANAAPTAKRVERVSVAARSPRRRPRITAWLLVLVPVSAATVASLWALRGPDVDRRQGPPQAKTLQTARRVPTSPSATPVLASRRGVGLEAHELAAAPKSTAGSSAITRGAIAPRAVRGPSSADRVPSARQRRPPRRPSARSAAGAARRKRSGAGGVKARPRQPRLVAANGTAKRDPISVLPSGTLAVASHPWGVVSIDGKNYGATDLQVKLASGSYTVRVDLSGGKGSFSTTARIAPLKKTKCRVVNQVIACRQPR